MLSFLQDHNYYLSKHVTTNLVLAIIVMMSSVFSYGFEQSVLSTIQAMDAYERKFGQFDTSTGEYGFTPSRLAFLNSFPLIAYAFGVVCASQIGERWGRRPVFWAMNSVCVAGVGLCYAAQTYPQALIGRMLVNIHVGAEAWLIPMWMAELVPGAIRGSVVAVYAFSHILAGFVASGITKATSGFVDDSSWQIPVAVMFTFPSFALLFSWLLPESPRWLLRRNRLSEAVTMISYLRCSAQTEYPAQAEAQLIMESLEEGSTKGKWSDLLEGVNKRRTWVGIIAACYTQLTGQSFASTYGTVFLEQVGVIDPFSGTMIKRAGLLCGCIFNILFIERIGRRNIALVGGSVSALFLFVLGGLGSISPPRVGSQNGILAMSILFPCSYMLAFGSTGPVIMSEAPHTSLRDKSSMVFWSISNISNFVATFTLPYLLKAPYAALGPMVGLIYGSTTVVFVVLIFFFVPEMTGRSLEEVDEMFAAGIPAWKSKHFVAAGGTQAAITALERSKNGEAVSAKMGNIEHREDVI